MVRLRGYRITVTQGHSAYECGEHYSFRRWGGDTRDYEGYDEPVALEMPEEYERDAENDLLYGADLATGGMDLQAAVDMGLVRVID